eukprot:gene2408-2872_t
MSRNSSDRMFVQGFFDASNFYESIKVFLVSRRLKNLFLQCCLLNGVIFTGSVLFLDYFAQPFLSFQEVDKFLKVFELSKMILWVIPVYIISLSLSSFWYNDISNILLNSRYKTPEFSIKSFILNIVTQIRSIFILLFFPIQISLIQWLSVLFKFETVGDILKFALTCWLYAYYAFEYRLAHSGVSLDNRLRYFEDRWAYMLGFGLPNALVTFFFPFFINNGIFALIFPLFIAAAVKASPPKTLVNPISLPIFWIPKNINKFFWFCIKKCC